MSPKTIAANPLAPLPPESIEALGLPRAMLTDLFLRFLREHGVVTIGMCKRALKLSYPIAMALFQDLRQKQLIDVRGASANDYQFSLTSGALELAAERSRVCRYAGPAPVPLEQYAATIRMQRPSQAPTAEELRAAFADLVVSEDIVDQIGPALASGRAIFIYGPTGNGKTSIIERLSLVYSDSILVPYAIEVDTKIISVFDPLVHRRVDVEPDEGQDQRWVRCHRPSVMAAGELTPSMLDLRLDDRSGVYAAPLQMKASNGILLIDDFGRQVMSPRQLFNRWILPLDRRVDYLSLEYGFTFQIPFELTLAFATNLDPADVADAAFLRRVPHKIYVEPITAEAFEEILRRVLVNYGLPFDPQLAKALRTVCMDRHSAGLQACYPKDICDILVARAAFKRQPFQVSRESLTIAAETYFSRMENSGKRPMPPNAGNSDDVN